MLPVQTFTVDEYATLKGISPQTAGEQLERLDDMGCPYVFSTRTAEKKHGRKFIGRSYAYSEGIKEKQYHNNHNVFPIDVKSVYTFDELAELMGTSKPMLTGLASKYPSRFPLIEVGKTYVITGEAVLTLFGSPLFEWPFVEPYKAVQRTDPIRPKDDTEGFTSQERKELGGIANNAVQYGLRLFAEQNGFQFDKTQHTDNPIIKACYLLAKRVRYGEAQEGTFMATTGPALDAIIKLCKNAATTEELAENVLEAEGIIKLLAS